MAAYIFDRFPPLSARWRHVASFPLPSAQACPKKITRGRTKEMKNDRQKWRTSLTPLPLNP